jgi:hypothetical protein
VRLHEQPPASRLLRCASPSLQNPTFDEVFRWSEGSERQFWQVSPVVVNNASIPCLPPAAHDYEQGVVLIAGGAAKAGGDAVHLAWMPLKPGEAPSRADILYYTGSGATCAEKWSADGSQAMPIFPLNYPGYTSISAMYVAQANLWVVLYSNARRDPGIYFPDKPVVVRTAPDPTQGWSDEIPLVSRNDQVAFPFPDPNSVPYGPFFIAENPATPSVLTSWDSANRRLTIHYLLSSWEPYQVHHMRSSFDVP